MGPHPHPRSPDASPANTDLSGDADPDSGHWHAIEAGAVLASLESSPEGLTASEAEARLERFGPNALDVGKPVSAWRILLDQFRGVVVWLLAAAAAISFFLGEPVDAVAVLAVLVINAAIGFATEYRARGAMAALLRLEVPRAIVVRDGTQQEVDARSLVPGDVIFLEAGMAVPVDARLLDSTELRTNEAPLTGESLPVDKAAAVVEDVDTPLADRTNMVYMSTAVVAGTARAIVTGTGMSTEVGRIGGLVREIQSERTPLEDRLDALGHRLVWVTLGVIVVVVGLGLLRGEDIGAMIQTGIALAVAAVPEGLPAVSTITLAVGVGRMARRNALVRRLPVVEALGSATTVCTDKTGTLTAGEMTVTAVWTAEREYGVTGSGYSPEGGFQLNDEPIDPATDEDLVEALRIGALTNRSIVDWSAQPPSVAGDPTEAALLVAARKAGLTREALRQEWPETGEIPFSSERMFMATFHEGPNGPVVFVKGAPARILERCTHFNAERGVVPLDDGHRDEILRRNRLMAGRGLRILALARGTAKPGEKSEDGPRDLAFIGLVGISDPPAPGVKETIEIFHTAGIRTVMITGDQRLTAQAVAADLGILEQGDEVVEGRDLQRMDTAEFPKRLPHISAFSRVNPEDKLRIIEGLQAHGEIVAMLGDGVNDAAALRKADIGVAMGIRGTDVAKEAADVVLEDDRFQTIGAAVEEGRVIFDNIRKFVFYLFSCNLAEVLVILMAGVFGLPQPLLPLQILWLNLITDTFPALSLAVEPGESDVMQRAPFDPARAILSAGFLRTVGFFALMITAATLAVFVWALMENPDDRSRAITMAFMTLALAQIFHLGNARSTETVLTPARAVANPWAIGAVVLTLGLQVAAVHFAPLAGILGLVPLTGREWMIAVGAAIVPAFIGQLLKAANRTRSAEDQPAIATRSP